MSNQKSIDYSREAKVDSHFKYFMTLYGKEEKLFALAPELQEMRNLKELYNVCSSTSRFCQPIE